MGLEERERQVDAGARLLLERYPAMPVGPRRLLASELLDVMSVSPRERQLAVIERVEQVELFPATFLLLVRTNGAEDSAVVGELVGEALKAAGRGDVFVLALDQEVDVTADAPVIRRIVEILGELDALNHPGPDQLSRERCEARLQVACEIVRGLVSRPIEDDEPF